MRTAMNRFDPIYDVQFMTDRSLRLPSKSYIPALQQSPLYQKLLRPFPYSTKNLILRLSQFAEINHSFADPHVRRLVMIMLEQNWTPQGFALMQDSADIDAVYNAIQTTLLIRLGLPDHDLLRVGINAILNTQPMRCQGAEFNPGKMGHQQKVTCIHSITKSLIALSIYQDRYPEKWTFRMQEKLDEGLDYLLFNDLFLDHRSDLDLQHLVFPFYPQASWLEMLRLMRDQSRLKHPGCRKALQWLQSHQQEDQYWYSSQAATLPGWVQFDDTYEPSLWITHLADDILRQAA